MSEEEVEVKQQANADLAQDAEKQTPEDNLSEAAEDERLRLRQECEELRDKYVRTVAELENFRKRKERELAERSRYAGDGVIRDLLEVVDTLDLAVLNGTKGGAEELLSGITLVRDRFKTILKAHAVESRSILGKQFDPSLAQALAHMPSKEHEPNTVVEEYKVAYFYRDRLLREGQVVVAAASVEQASPNGGDSRAKEAVSGADVEENAVEEEAQRDN